MLGSQVTIYDYVDKRQYDLNAYGVYILEGGYNAMIAYPPTKAVRTNDWYEEDGIEVDVRNLYLDGREFSLKVAIVGMESKFFSLIELLTSKTYFDFSFNEVGLNKRLRFVGESNPNHNIHLGFATLRFAEDFPMRIKPDGEEYRYSPPYSSIPECNDFLFSYENYQENNPRYVPFTDYGIRVLEGSLSEVLKVPDVKKGMTRYIRTVNGIIYDEGKVVEIYEVGGEEKERITYVKTHLSGKTAKLHLLMRADSVQQLWHNYYAFLHDLIRQDERRIYVTDVEQGFTFYYKSCTVNSFYLPRPWLEFTLEIVMTGNNPRVSDEDILLATRDDLVSTENDEFINME